MCLVDFLVRFVYITGDESKRYSVWTILIVFLLEKGMLYWVFGSGAMPELRLNVLSGL